MKVTSELKTKIKREFENSCSEQKKVLLQKIEEIKDNERKKLKAEFEGFCQDENYSESFRKMLPEHTYYSDPVQRMMEKLPIPEVDAIRIEIEKIRKEESLREESFIIQISYLKDFEELKALFAKNNMSL